VKDTRPFDQRYSRAWWRRVRKRVLVRDGYRCQVEPGCPIPATVADHIVPVYQGMSDAEFHDETNLRAACQMHNQWRAQLERARVGGEAVSSSEGNRRQLAPRHLHMQPRSGSVFDPGSSPARVYGGRR
jgi:hypothetical protein